LHRATSAHLLCKALVRGVDLAKAVSIDAAKGRMARDVDIAL
jgi:hypothetical protein